MTDQHYMKLALQQAQRALDDGEVPVGSLVVCNDRIIAKGYNQTERLHDVTAHAEILAITAASNYLGNKYLMDCTLYVTLEPCPMCAHALFLSKLKKVVFGAYDPKRGFLSLDRRMLHPKTELIPGIMEASCSELLQQFFQSKRKL